LDDRSGNGFYSDWVSEQLDHGLEPLFEEFPVLARQVHRLISTWKVTTLDLFDRTDDDWEVLGDFLKGTRNLGSLLSIRPGLSDRHHGGRQVAVLGFEGGEQVVYKSRSLEMEGAFAAFLDWLEVEGLDPIPQRPGVVPRGEYGWMEVIQEPELTEAEDLSRWFMAAGVLACLAHILGASDLHVGNVLPGISSPVLIDLETLLHPEVSVGRESEVLVRSATAEVFKQVRSSFLTTGMLTFLQEGPDGTVIDIGGLCGTGGHVLGVETTGWSGLRCDGLSPVKQQTRATQRCNVPVIDGVPQTVQEHAEEIETGFSTAYRFVMSRRSHLQGPEGVMRWFGGLRTRVLLRPTEMYARVLQLAIGQRYQRNGISTGVIIEALGRPLVRAAGPRPPQWDLIEWEREALEGLDIPHLTVPVDAVALEGSDGQTIEGVISASGVELFRGRLDGMSEEDLQRQLHLMALSLQTPAVEHDHASVASSGGQAPMGSALPHRLSDEALLDVARTVADELMERAVQGPDRSLIWLDPVHLRPEGRRDRGVSYYLYSGSAGIALFFSAMARAFPDGPYCEAAEGALLPIVSVLNDAHADVLLADEGLGACNGLGGIVYALTLASVFLNKPEYLASARQAVNCITPERIVLDHTLDVEGGSAGAILGLLALQDVRPEDLLLERALACGRHLLDRQKKNDGGGGAWESGQGGMLAGFAHGASGIALALVRLWRWVRDSSLLDGAVRAMDFENTLFDSEKKNWPLVLIDSKTGQTERREMSAWCHGAPGIALARSCIRDAVPEAEANGRLDGALATTLEATMEGPDHLCCGNLGRVDVMLTTGGVLGRETLRRAAELRAAMVIQRAVTTGSFRLKEGRGMNKTGFFRGLAGVGYQMLRLVRPEEVPSVLAFQSIPAVGDSR
jgi:type 2 lantibiotic biosynthesis protein LanM